MSAQTLTRLAALGWLVAALARVGGAIAGFGTSDATGSIAALAVGVGLGMAVAAWLWLRPGRTSTIGATILGSYAVTALLYLPIVGPQPWFLALALTGLAAFALSLGAAVAVRRQTPPTDHAAGQ